MKRRALLLGSVVFVGVALNWAVAWASVLWAPVQDHLDFSPYTDADLAWLIDEGDLPDPDRSVTGSKAIGCSYKVFSLRNELSTDRLLAIARSWKSASLARPDHWFIPAHVAQTRAGWPFYSLYGEERVHSLRDTGERVPSPTPIHQRVSYSWALPVPASWGSSKHLEALPVALPLRPMFPAFIVNTAVYSLLVMLAVAGPIYVRQRVRIAHGRCPRCAFPRGSSRVCTECGTSVGRRAHV